MQGNRYWCDYPSPEGMMVGARVGVAAIGVNSYTGGEVALAELANRKGNIRYNEMFVKPWEIETPSSEPRRRGSSPLPEHLFERLA